MISSFARSAALMEQAGWDGVELLAARVTDSPNSFLPR